MKSENKISILLLALSIILPVLFIMLFIKDKEKIEKISLDEATELSMVTEYGIENIIVDNTNIFLSGWLIEKPDTISKVNRNFILSDGNNTYKLNTIMEKRSDITERWNNGNNYDNSGLQGNGLIKYLNKGQYRIGFLIINNSEQYYYMTDVYLEVT